MHTITIIIHCLVYIVQVGNNLEKFRLFWIGIYLFRNRNELSIRNVYKEFIVWNFCSRPYWENLNFRSVSKIIEFLENPTKKHTWPLVFLLFMCLLQIFYEQKLFHWTKTILFRISAKGFWTKIFVKHFLYIFIWPFNFKFSWFAYHAVVVVWCTFTTFKCGIASLPPLRSTKLKRH